MKLITIFLLLNIYCIASHGAFLAKTNPLFEIESKVLKEKINYKDYRKFALTKDDDFKTTFYKLALQYRCFREAKENFGNMGIQLMRDCKIAHQKFPNSPEIAMYYFRMNAIFCQDTKNFQFADMVGLIPYINCSKNVPGIPRVMVAIIKDRISNLKNILPKNGYTFQRYSAITGGRTFEEIKQRLELLADYWIIQIDPEYSKRWTKKEIDKVRQKMTYAKIQEAIGIWKNIIRECNIGYIDDLKMKFRNELAAEQFKRNEAILKQKE